MASEFSSFSLDLVERTSELQKVEDEYARWLLDRAWYNEFDPTTARASLKKVRDEKKMIDCKLEGTTAKIATLCKQIEHLKASTRLGVDLLKLFSSERAVSLRELNSTQCSLAQEQEKFTHLAVQSAAAGDRISLLQADLDRHLAFSPLTADAAIRQLPDYIKRLKALKEKLQPYQEKLDQARERLENLTKKENHLKELAEGLTQAQSSYDRAIIHQNCEKLYGDGKPYRLLEKTKSEIDPIKRDIIKFKERIQKEAQRHWRSVSRNAPATGSTGNRGSSIPPEPAVPPENGIS